MHIAVSQYSSEGSAVYGGTTLKKTVPRMPTPAGDRSSCPFPERNRFTRVAMVLQKRTVSSRALPALYTPFLPALHLIPRILYHSCRLANRGQLLANNPAPRSLSLSPLNLFYWALP